MSDPVPERLRAALEGVRSRVHTLGHRLVYFHEIGSTNDAAAQLANSGAPEGTIVVAAEQTQGRGRQGRDWQSPAGAGAYFSLVLRPNLMEGKTAVTLLTLTAGVAVAEGIQRACGLAFDIKWPNDLVAARPEPDARAPRWQKLAGILAEAAIAGRVLQHVILGIGVNVRDVPFSPELAARVTSVAREVGRDVEPYDVIAECVAAFGERWLQVLEGRYKAVLDEWRRRSPSAIGAPVIVPTGDGPAQGVTAGLQDDGSLAIDVRGTRIRVGAGEVQWL